MLENPEKDSSFIPTSSRSSSHNHKYIECVGEGHGIICQSREEFGALMFTFGFESKNYEMPKLVFPGTEDITAAASLSLAEASCLRDKLAGWGLIRPDGH